MAAITGNVTNANGMLAHINLLDIIRQAAEDTGNWTALRWDDAAGELILQGNGYSGDKEIFIGFLCYQNSDLDYYNISTAAFTGYVAGNTFNTQPGYYASAVPAHATSIEYWINISPQRITGALRIAGVAWEFFYLGFFNPFSSPTAYPYPMLVAGMLASATAAVRFSDTAPVSPLKAASTRSRLRNNTEWIAPTFHPLSSPAFNTETSSYGVGKLRDIFGTIPLLPITIYTTLGCWGELEGVFFAPWFNASTGDTATIADVDYILVGNSRAALADDGLMLRLD
ncbi:MAG: hypothetical protein LBI92_06880 [Azoarcus sp.]|jgi:hypothetical protein|nr:hypothetical protein [Azoarcus sp.]